MNLSLQLGSHAMSISSYIHSAIVVKFCVGATQILNTLYNNNNNSKACNVKWSKQTIKATTTAATKDSMNEISTLIEYYKNKF